MNMNLSHQNDDTQHATITVAFGDQKITIALDGAELSEVVGADGTVRRYLTTASRDHIGAEVERALVALLDGQPLPLTERWEAHFTPQAWQGDYAVDVDPEGDQAWDCSAYAAENSTYITGLLLRDHLLSEPGVEVTDNDDVFQADPAAPAWVGSWVGPFHITLTRTA